MAEDVNLRRDPELTSAAPTPVLVQPITDRRERARRSSYRTRFGVVYVGLALLLVAAVAALALLLTRPAPPDAAAWSDWEPEGSALARMQQIADRIPKAYLLPSQDQLNIAIARELVARANDSTVPVGTILVDGGGAGADDVVVHDAAGTVGIALCGLGPSCSLPGGETSDALFAVRRQATELALYAFKYVDGLDSIVIFLPPTAKGESAGAIFLLRENVQAELDAPLAETLPTRPAQIVGESSSEELAAVVRLTDSRVYSFAYEAAPDGNLVMVLTPPELAA